MTNKRKDLYQKWKNLIKIDKVYIRDGELDLQQRYVRQEKRVMYGLEIK